MGKKGGLNYLINIDSYITKLITAKIQLPPLLLYNVLLNFNNITRAYSKIYCETQTEISHNIFNM